MDRTSKAYKGYLLTYPLVGDLVYISKQGHHIGSAPNMEAAKREIDALTDN